MQKKIDVAQGSQEWLDFRSFKIGASDIPVIVGVSPYKTPLQLYREKVEFFDLKTNPSMEFGKRNEENIRNSLNEMLKTNFIPSVYQLEEFPWAICSLDGEYEDTFLEIKCANADDHKLAIDGKVPAHYMPQLQWQFFVSGLSKGIYCSYHNKDIIYFHVERDNVMIADLLAKAKAFYLRMVNMDPPPMTDKDYFVVEDEKLISLAEEYKEKLAIYNELGDWLSEAKSYLTDKMEHDINLIGSLKIQKVVRKGTVQYSKIPELQEIDLDQYRGDDVISWRLTT